MKWRRKGCWLYANSQENIGVVFIINTFRDQMFIYQGRRQVYFTDSIDEIKRFFLEFGEEYYH